MQKRFSLTNASDPRDKTNPDKKRINKEQQTNIHRRKQADGRRQRRHRRPTTNADDKRFANKIGRQFKLQALRRQQTIPVNTAAA